MESGFTFIDAWWWPYLFILLIGWLPTDIWRALGVLMSGGIDENSEMLVFVRAVATALVAAVISKLILFPAGNLSVVPVELRILAASLGFASFIISGKRVFIGILVAETILIGGSWWLGVF